MARQMSPWQCSPFQTKRVTDATAIWSQPTQSVDRPRPSSGRPVALLAMNVYFFSLCKEREELTKRQPHTGLVQAGLRSAKLHDRCGDLSTVAIANTPVVRRKRTQHRASNRRYQFRCIVPHVSDCAAYLPGLHLFRWIRPEQIRWQMSRLTRFQPSLVILWSQDHWHTIMDRF